TPPVRRHAPTGEADCHACALNHLRCTPRSPARNTAGDGWRRCERLSERRIHPPDQERRWCAAERPANRRDPRPYREHEYETAGWSGPRRSARAAPTGVGVHDVCSVRTCWHVTTPSEKTMPSVNETLCQCRGLRVLV